MTDLFLDYLNAGFFGGVIILIGLLLRLLLRNAPRRMLCAVWLLAAVRLLLPIDLESHFSLQPRYTPAVVVRQEQNQQTQETQPAPEQVRPVPSLPEMEPDLEDVPQMPPVIPETPVKPNPETPPIVQEQPSLEKVTTTAEETVKAMDIVTAAWVTVMVALGLYGLASYIVLKRRVQTAVKCADGVRECERINSAFLLGYWKPEIYLPMGIAPRDRAFIITHEQTHKKRGDHWWKLIGLLCVAIHWYNPLVWVGYVLMCRDVEIACDEQVVAAMNLAERKAYSLALLNSGKRISGILACPVAFGEVSLKQRIKKVLAYRQPGFWITAVAITLVVFVGLCFLTSPIVEPKNSDATTPPTTQPSTVPTEPSTVPTEPSTVPTEPPTTQPTEPSTVSTEPPATQPTEPSTVPTDPTKPGEISVIAGG